MAIQANLKKEVALTISGNGTTLQKANRVIYLVLKYIKVINPKNRVWPSLNLENPKRNCEKAHGTGKCIELNKTKYQSSNSIGYTYACNSNSWYNWVSWSYKCFVKFPLSFDFTKTNGLITQTRPDTFTIDNYSLKVLDLLRFA